MRANRIRPQFVEFIPDHLEAGVLYVSQRLRMCSHKCCCGCGEEVVTPLSPAEWQLTCEHDLVSMGINRELGLCVSLTLLNSAQSHEASARDDGQAIARMRQRDTSDLADMINVGNLEKDREFVAIPPASPPHALSHSTPSCDKSNVAYDKRRGWFMKLLRFCFGD